MRPWCYNGIPIHQPINSGVNDTLGLTLTSRDVLCPHDVFWAEYAASPFSGSPLFTVFFRAWICPLSLRNQDTHFSHLPPKSWDFNACIGTYKNYRKTKSYTPFHLWGYDYTNINMKPAKIGIFLPPKCDCFENPHHLKNDKQHIELSQLQLCFVSTIALGFQCCKLLQSPPKLSWAQSRRNLWLLWGCIQKMRIWYFW